MRRRIPSRSTTTPVNAIGETTSTDWFLQPEFRPVDAGCPTGLLTCRPYDECDFEFEEER